MTVTAASTSARPPASATSGSNSGSAAQNVERVSGMTTRFTGMMTASITSSVTGFVATTANGSSCRGKRTCFTRLACPSRLVHDDLERALEEDPRDEAGEQEERVVVDADGVEEHREDDPVDAHQGEWEHQRPAEPEHRAAVLHAQLAPEEVEEQVAVPEEVGVERHGRQV